MTVSASIRTCAYVAELSGRDLRGQLPLLLSLLLLSEFERDEDEDLVDLFDLVVGFDDAVFVVALGVARWTGFGATRTGVRTGAIRRGVGFGVLGGGGGVVGGGAAIGGTNGCTDDEPTSDTAVGGTELLLEPVAQNSSPPANATTPASRKASTLFDGPFCSTGGGGGGGQALTGPEGGQLCAGPGGGGPGGGQPLGGPPCCGPPCCQPPGPFGRPGPGPGAEPRLSHPGCGMAAILLVAIGSGWLTWGAVLGSASSLARPDLAGPFAHSTGSVRRGASALVGPPPALPVSPFVGVPESSAVGSGRARRVSSEAIECRPVRRAGRIRDSDPPT